MSSVSALRWEDRTVRGGICLVLCVVTAAYLLPFVDRGWIAHDDGMLGQMAERVLAGEIPHRDFDDPYTGGLTYLHALGFKLFGVRLLSLRWLLFGRHPRVGPGRLLSSGPVRSPGSGSARHGCRSHVEPSELLCQHAVVLQPVPGHVGHRGVVSPHRTRGARLARSGGLVRWGVVSREVCRCLLPRCAAACSCCFERRPKTVRTGNPDARPSTGFLLLEAAGCLVLVTALVSLVGERRTVMNVLHFVAPLAAVVGVLLWSEWREGRGALGTRVRRAWALLWPFAAGAVVPVAIFLLPYIATGTMGAISDGVFLALDRRLGQAERSLPPAGNLAWALPYGAVLLAVALGVARSMERYCRNRGRPGIRGRPCDGRSRRLLPGAVELCPVPACVRDAGRLCPGALSAAEPAVDPTPASLPASGGAGGDRPGAVSVFRAYLLLLHSADAASCHVARGQPGGAPPPSGRYWWDISPSPSCLSMPATFGTSA